MDTQEIIEWLNSDEGLSWSYGQFDDATECHDIIEITYDYNSAAGWSDAVTGSNREVFRHLRITRPMWRDLKWTPDHPPEGGLPLKRRRR